MPTPEGGNKIIIGTNQILLLKELKAKGINVLADEFDTTSIVGLFKEYFRNNTGQPSEAYCNNNLEQLRTKLFTLAGLLIGGANPEGTQPIELVSRSTRRSKGGSGIFSPRMTKKILRQEEQDFGPVYSLTFGPRELDILKSYSERQVDIRALDLCTMQSSSEFTEVLNMMGNPSMQNAEVQFTNLRSKLIYFADLLIWEPQNTVNVQSPAL